MNGLLATTGACILGRMSAMRTVIAGFPIFDTALIREATDFAQHVSAQLLVVNSRPVFL